jgi:hypothetical protein
MGSRRRRQFKNRTSSPAPARRFRNFVKLVGVHRIARAIGANDSTVQGWSSGRTYPNVANICAVIDFSESLLTRARPPEDVFGDGRPLEFRDIVDFRHVGFEERKPNP